MVFFMRCVVHQNIFKSCLREVSFFGYISFNACLRYKITIASYLLKNKPQTQYRISRVFNITAYIQTTGSNIILHTMYLCAALSHISHVTSYWHLKQFTIFLPCHYTLLVYLPSLRRGRLLHYSLSCCMYLYSS